MSLNYRVLPADEWPRLVSYMTRMENYTVPSPETAVVAVCEDETGSICGVLVQQLCWHREPLVLNNPNVHFNRLSSLLDTQFAPYSPTIYYAFTDNPRVLKMATLEGMQVMNGQLLRGEC